MKVAFHSNQLDLRGTGVALYQYTHYNETLLGNDSFIIYPSRAAHGPYQDATAESRFAERFSIERYDDLGELDSILESHGADLFYALKSGERDGVVA